VLKNTKKALVFVESPFQVANLIDLTKFQPSTKFNIYVRLNGDKKNDDAIMRKVKSCVQENTVFRILKINKAGSKKYLQLVYLFRCITSIIFSNIVIFSDDRSVIYKFLKSLAKGKIFLADDGAYSFVKIAELENEKNSGVIGFITRFEGLKSKKIEIINLPYKKTELKVENYSLIIGMPLSEKGIISERDHLELILSMVKKVKVLTGNKAYYFPHRSERSYLQLDLLIIESELSVEEYVEVVSKNAPSHIISMYSTALFVLSSKFTGLKCFYYKINEKLIKSDEITKNIRLVYEALGSTTCKELV
jgi:hypothetical protein